MAIYENIIIGNFLFALSLKIGAYREGTFVPGLGVHLMQQTPLDVVLGDVLLAGPRSIALLEFKRAADRRSKESRKLVALAALLRNATFSALQDISRDMHFYVETSDVMEKGFSRVLPYLDLSMNDTGSTLEQLIDELASRARSGIAMSQAQMEACQRYLELVCICKGRSYRASPGILIGVGGDGRIAFAPLEDVRDIQSTFGAIRAQEIALAQSITRAQVQRARERLTYALAGRFQALRAAWDGNGMAGNSKLSAREWAAAVTTLIDEATLQQERCEELLGQLATTLDALQSRTEEFAHDMPSKIARQTADGVVQKVADLVARSVADVLRPSEANARTLLHELETAVAEYRRAARDAFRDCILFGCLSSASTTLLIIGAMKFFRIL